MDALRHHGVAARALVVGVQIEQREGEDVAQAGVQRRWPAAASVFGRASVPVVALEAEVVVVAVHRSSLLPWETSLAALVAALSARSRAGC